MRVLWVTNMFHEEGSSDYRGIFVTQQWNALLATGQVQLERVLVAQGQDWKDYFRANRRVRDAWDRGRFDLVHVHYGLTGLATLTLPSAAKRIFTFYGSDINQPLARTIAYVTARKALRRIFVARRLADQWRGEPNRVIPNGVDFDVCRPIPREEACRALGLDPAVRWVLFGGAPSNEVKGYPVFSSVVERVRQTHPNARELVLTGPNQTYEGVVQKLNAADVLLFTSQRGSEGSPTVVKEALAVGCPVVSVDVGDAPEMLEGVTPGALAPWLGSDAPVDRLVKEVGKILAAPARSNGRELRQFLRQELIADRTLQLYKEVRAA